MNQHDIDRLLDRHRDRFRRLVRQIIAEEAGEDPFAFPLERYLELDEEQKAEIVERAGIVARDFVEQELRARGAAWIVVAGDQVVAESKDAQALPTAEQVLDYGRAQGVVAYLFEAALIEETSDSFAAWAALTGSDRYPTIPLRLWHSSEAGPTSIVADLDTGAHATLIDADLVAAAADTWFEGRHLGETFLWAPTLVTVEAVPTQGEPTRIEVPARKVRRWSASPFVRINPKRMALCGRDRLRALGATLVLRTPRGETEIVELASRS